MKVLVTGAAGFIGSKVMYGLARRGDEVVGIDNINDYYDVRLKYGRLRQCGFVAAAPAAAAASSSEVPHFGFGEVHVSSELPNYRFIRIDIADKAAVDRLFEMEKFDKVVNLAAQAGVRYSIENPYAYLQSNLTGFMIYKEFQRLRQSGALPRGCKRSPRVAEIE